VRHYSLGHTVSQPPPRGRPTRLHVFARYLVAGHLRRGTRCWLAMPPSVGAGESFFVPALVQLAVKAGLKVAWFTGVHSVCWSAASALAIR
jgi:hypothetical protein